MACRGSILPPVCARQTETLAAARRHPWLVMTAAIAVTAPASVQAAPAEKAAGEATVEIPAAAAGALRAMGDVAFYTSAARPLRRLADLTAPEREVATADLGLARGLMGFLRAGGVRFSGGAFAIGRLTSAHHFPVAFRGATSPRLLVVRSGAVDETALVAKGGGLRLQFRIAGEPAALPVARASAAPSPSSSATASPVTSFGPLTRVTLASTARTRQFDPAVDGAKPRTAEHRARAGHTLVVLHIARDFGAGLGTISFLFGSGIILEPDFSGLVVIGQGRRHKPVASHADGLNLELVYEVPAPARDLSLQDGAARWPLTPLIRAASAAL